MTSSLIMAKVTHISEARRRRFGDKRGSDMELDTDTRRDARAGLRDKLFVQIVKSDNQDMVGTTISCETLDVSPHGIRIGSPIPVPEGSHLDLWVDNSTGAGKFFLSSDVRWARAKDGMFECGVELHPGPATDIEAWQEAHTS